MEEQINRKMDDGQMDVGMDGWIDKQKDGWMGRQRD